METFVSRVCARWLIFPQTFWNCSPVRNEDNMKLTASNLKRYGNPPRVLEPV
jgi:hypothetical protein